MGANVSVREAAQPNERDRISAIGKFQPRVTVATGTGIAGTVQICRVSLGVRIVDRIAPIIGHPVGVAQTQINGERQRLAFPARVKRLSRVGVFDGGVR